MGNLRLHFPLFVKWNIASNCNLRCKHCFISNYNNNFPEVSKIKMLIDGLADKKIATLFLTGGEPFLRSDLEEIVSFIENRFNTVIATNGTLITENRVEQLKKYGVNIYQVSLDGFNSETNDFIRGKGSFDKSVKGIEILKKNNCKVTLAYTLNSYNYNYIENIISLAESLNVNYLRFELFIPLGNGRNSSLDLSKGQLESIKDVLRSLGNKYSVKIVLPEFNSEYGCGAAYFSCIINGDFSISPCDMLTDMYKSDPINSIEDFERIWLKSSVFEEWRSFTVTDEYCFSCNHNQKCNSGCRASAIAYNGNMNTVDKLCLRGDSK